MTFQKYLAGRRPTYDAKGDFVRLALADSEMPDFRAGVDLKRYLEGRGLSEDQVEAAGMLWRKFQGQSQHDRT